MSARIVVGDVRDVLATLDAGSVQTCVTSPPYYALRDYGVAGQIGLEPTIAEYLATMVDVFRAVRRVLRDDGTLWLNIGDIYNSNPAGMSARGLNGSGSRQMAVTRHMVGTRAVGTGSSKTTDLKPKDLMLIPARLALALQDDGWWVRSEIIWAKPNPMPESVQDRPTVAHEHIWLLTKQSRYFYDADAIRTVAKSNYMSRPDGWADSGSHDAVSHSRRDKQRGHGRRHDGFNDRWDGMSKDEQQAMGANARTVWDIATSGFSGAHFATFPTEIPRRCILAGTSEKGCCPACGAPWKRETSIFQEVLSGNKGRNTQVPDAHNWDGVQTRTRKHVTTTGWQPTCICAAGDPVPCVVLDPFGGAMTTGVVALRLGRSFVGVELNPTYAEMGRKRMYGDAPLLNRVALDAA